MVSGKENKTKTWRRVVVVAAYYCLELENIQAKSNSRESNDVNTLTGQSWMQVGFRMSRCQTLSREQDQETQSRRGAGAARTLREYQKTSERAGLHYATQRVHCLWWHSQPAAKPERQVFFRCRMLPIICPSAHRYRVCVFKESVLYVDSRNSGLNRHSLGHLEYARDYESRGREWSWDRRNFFLQNPQRRNNSSTCWYSCFEFQSPVDIES